MDATWLPVERIPTAGLTGIFTDIDDTLTTAGKLPAEVYAALEREAERRHRVFGAVLRLASVRHDVRHGDIRQRRRRRHAESGRDKRDLHECCRAEARRHAFCLHFYNDHGGKTGYCMALTPGGSQ